MEKVWKFVDKTNGSELECNDLGFLIFTLTEERGLNIPATTGINLMIQGAVDLEVKGEDGSIHDITIGEKLPQTFIYQTRRHPVLH